MNNPIVIISLIVSLIVWNTILTYMYLQQQRFFSHLTSGISKNDLKTILAKISQSMKHLKSHLTKIDGKINHIQTEATHHFQKMGFVRFNPFSDTGGDQSFCICLLNQHDDGIIITSLHSREQTRIYAKPIKKGKGQGATFFDEEKEALKRALKPHGKRKKSSA